MLPRVWSRARLVSRTAGVGAGRLSRSSAVCRRAMHAARVSAADAARAAADGAGAATAALRAGLTASSEKAQGNVPVSVMSKIGRNLHRTPHHPINLLKTKIERYFASTYGAGAFRAFDDLSPVVTTKQNFDDLLVPADHPSRALSDTFYLDAERVLRPHTSAHQNDLLRAGERAFLVTGDCYRRDEIDATHYPTFHQMEGVRVWARDGSDAQHAVTPVPPPLPPMPAAALAAATASGPPPGTTVTSPGAANAPAVRMRAGEPVTTQHVVTDLKHTLEGLVRHLFGASTPARWIDAYFPFTEPSLELEVFYGGKWLEVLGCGAIHTRLLQRCALDDRIGWAFGIGLERLAMVLYDIPDIRLFWSDDPRFLAQFAAEAERERTRPHSSPVRFKPFSTFSPVIKDVSFWLPPGSATGATPAATHVSATASSVAASSPDRASGAFHDNDLYSVVRDVAGDLVESVRLVDVFANPKTGRVSRCYRITYRHLSRMLTNAEIDVMQSQVRQRLAMRPDIELR